MTGRSDANTMMEYFHIIYDIPQTNSTLIKAVREATGKSDFDPFQGI